MKNKNEEMEELLYYIRDEWLENLDISQDEIEYMKNLINFALNEGGDS